MCIVYTKKHFQRTTPASQDRGINLSLFRPYKSSAGLSTAHHTLLSWAEAKVQWRTRVITKLYVFIRAEAFEIGGVLSRQRRRRVPINSLELLAERRVAERDYGSCAMWRLTVDFCLCRQWWNKLGKKRLRITNLGKKELGYWMKFISFIFLT